MPDDKKLPSIRLPDYDPEKKGAVSPPTPREPPDVPTPEPPPSTPPEKDKPEPKDS